MANKYIHKGSIGGASTDPAVIRFENAEAVYKHSKIIMQYAGAELEEIVGECDGLSEALDFFGMLVLQEPLDNSILFDVRAPKRVLKVQREEPQFFELLSELDVALENLRSYFHGINDQERVHSDIGSVLIYIDAFRLFLKGSASGSVELPTDIPRSLYDKLREANWSEISDQARKWIDTICKFIKAIM